jgi:hypothetical protein
MTCIVPPWVGAAIDRAMRVNDPQWVIPNRYPFTYAYDFVRNHSEAFRRADTPGANLLPLFPSRGDVASWMRIVADDLGSRSPVNVAICRALADAYITEHGYVWADGDTPDGVIAEKSRRQPDGTYYWFGPTERDRSEGRAEVKEPALDAAHRSVTPSR